MDTTLIILLLVGVIQVCLVLSIVHMSGKMDEMANTLNSINEKLGKIMHDSKN